VPDSVLFDAFQVKLLLPASADEATADAARAALDDPMFLDAVRHAVQAVLAAARRSRC
jgi:hypothetical protein